MLGCLLAVFLMIASVVFRLFEWALLGALIVPYNYLVFDVHSRYLLRLQLEQLEEDDPDHAEKALKLQAKSMWGFSFVWLDVLMNLTIVYYLGTKGWFIPYVLERLK